MSEDKKLRPLMRGVKEQRFGGLVRSPPKTVAEFLTDAVTMEKALHQRSHQYYRQVNLSSATSSLRQQPAVVREVQHALGTPCYEAALQAAPPDQAFTT